MATGVCVVSEKYFSSFIAPLIALYLAALFLGEPVTRRALLASVLALAGVFVIAAAWGGLLIGGVYMLRAIRDLLHGPVRAELPKGGDAGPWRRVPFLTLLAALIFFGINPASLVDRITPAATGVARSPHASAPTAGSEPAGHVAVTTSHTGR